MRRISLIRSLARSHGLVLVGPQDLVLSRRRAGTGFSFRDADGRPIRDSDTVRRLRALAVPPAYEKVRFAADPQAHLQAVGEDAAGRLQYRYHPAWTQVREALKARRLNALAQALPTIRRAIGRHLGAGGEGRDFTYAAVLELVALTAIRAGSESYAREHGTRGATTLLKSHVKIVEGRVTLRFTAKGGKKVVKEICNPRFVIVMRALLALPGRRLFQYRGEDGALHPVRAGEVNAFLKRIAGCPLSLKDFRTLVASVSALELLAAAAPAGSVRARRSQVVKAVASVAETLANTPSVCRTSYVHAAVVTAFEEGALRGFADELKGTRSPAARAEILARIVGRYAAPNRTKDLRS
ncbi:DNA topoisomerase IB [Ancylobacter sp. 6x-1]|uniref:DNA topoisomerase IB n=1 Tax=Ancylobacter crimeensis TaxID=2579147 RepID=A0ABT0D9T6_9HYPH|nr:DNA topoisomerase IB [Ancylobacter crimeensis]MCK0196716.1 DNA topoisomerase IB [Ancylobacter crimeensis]